MIQIERFAYSPMGTFGIMKFGEFECYTVERPWENNKKDVSCIPEGLYTAHRYNSPTPGRGIVWQLNNVPHRDFIQIHKGNTMRDVVGCIAVGTGLGFINGLWAVVDSRTAFAELMEATKDLDEINVSIIGVRHES